MNKKLIITILCVMSAKLVFADIGYISYSSVSLAVYLYSIIPVILWITNLIIGIITIMRKNVVKGLFWFVNVLSVLLALMLIYPVSIDISQMGYQSFNIYGLALIVLIIIPLTISANSMRIRIGKNRTKHD